MDNKIDSLLLLIQRQQEQINSIFQGIMDLENRQDEMNALFDSQINKIMISSGEIQNSQNLLKNSLSILQREVKSSIEEANEKVLSLNKIEKDFTLDKIEKYGISIKKDLERLTDLENVQEEIKNQLEIKIEDIMKKYTFDILEKSKEQYHLHQMEIDKAKNQAEKYIADCNKNLIENLKEDKLEIKQYMSEQLEGNQNRNSRELVKQFNTVVHSLGLLLESIENSRSQVNNTVYGLRSFIENIVEADMRKILTANEEGKDLIMEMIEKNSAAITRDMGSLDSGLRMLLLNSIMEQLPQE